jgi:hypothetical protein
MNAPVKPKTVALQNSTPIVKSAKLPATRGKREYRDFDDFARLGKTLVERFDDVVVRGNADDGTTLPMIKAFWVETAFFDRDTLYEETKKKRPNHVGCHTDRQITRRVVSEEISLLIGGFPNAGPHSPKVYTRMMIEEIVAANPTAVALEGACREIRRTKTFAPSIPELLEALRQHEERWDNHKGWISALEERLEQERAKR